MNFYLTIKNTSTLTLFLFNASAWKFFIQFNYQEAATKRCFYRGYFEISASASQHEHRHCKKSSFFFKNFFLKIEYICSFLSLVMVSVQLCYKYDLLFIHSKASIGVLEKGYLNFRNHLSVGVLKKQLLRKFLHILYAFQRNIEDGVLFKYTRRLSWDFSKKLFRIAILKRTY